MFLQGRAQDVVFDWGKRNQLDTQSDQVCWSPSHNKTLASNHLEKKMDDNYSSALFLLLHLYQDESLQGVTPYTVIHTHCMVNLE